MVREKKRGGEEGADRDDVEGKRASNLGSDPGMPQREEQRGCDPLAVHSPSAPQGVARQDQVKTLSPSLKAGTGVLTQRSTPKTSRSKQSRQTHQRGRKPAPTTRNPQANKTQSTPADRLLEQPPTVSTHAQEAGSNNRATALHNGSTESNPG